MKLKVSRIASRMRHPKDTALRILYGKDAILCDRLAWLAGATDKEARQVYDEAASDTHLESHIREAFEGALGAYHAEVRFREAYCLYIICRLIRPGKVVETGVGAGVSSAFILRALDLNSKGILHSIDLPKYEAPGVEGHIVPFGKEPGFVVPPDTRGRWNLNLGPSSELLFKMVGPAENVDLFFHDSDHSYKNMTFEYETVWPALRKGGVLLSHDVDQNAAFSDFALEKRTKSVYLPGTFLGGMRK